MLKTPLALLALAVVFASASARAAPCAGFTDVDDASPFCVNVEWMRNRGITLGCAATLYCPNDFVTRLQMAAFMYRLGFQNAFLQGGNAFATTAVLGTIDAQPVEIVANAARVMRYEPHAISPNVIGGHPANSVTSGVRGATIAGGGVTVGNSDPNFLDEAPNRVTDVYGTIGGGYANEAGNDAGTTIDRPFATVSGGAENTASGAYSVIGGGEANTASGGHSTIAGGASNSASGNYSTNGGGLNNTASGTYGTIAGGISNIAAGDYSSVPGGRLNVASGIYSFAAGFRAQATATGSFVWADSQDFQFQSSAANTFNVRATGGVGLAVAIDPVTGVATEVCNLIAGTPGWTCTSDRNAKERLEAVDPAEVLERLVPLPVYTYTFKGADPEHRNMGPTAQDFHAAFGLGKSTTTIAGGNVDGVALAAIQGLNAKLEAKIAEQARDLATQQTQIVELQRVVAQLLAGR